MQRVVWDGTTNNGTEANKGLYLVSVTDKTNKITGRLKVLKE
jgi:flagellar hook assembly protein FlgD